MIFKKVGCSSKNEEVKRGKEQEKLEFKLSNESHGSTESSESEEEVEPQTHTIKRSS